MNNKHLQFGRKFGKLSVAMLMLLFSLLWAVSAKSQSPLANNLVTFNFLTAGGNTTSSFVGVGNTRTSYRTGFSGATLDTIVLSHVSGVCGDRRQA